MENKPVLDNYGWLKTSDKTSVLSVSMYTATENIKFTNYPSQSTPFTSLLLSIRLLG